MKIDTHAHIWGPGLESPRNMQIIEACRRFSIEKVLISCVSEFGGYGPDEKDIKDSNDFLVGFMDKYSDLVRGMIYLNPRHANSVEVMQKYLENPKMVGIKLWIAAYADEPCVNSIMEEAIRQDVPVLFHAWHKRVDQLEYEPDGVHVAAIANRYPEAKIIMAHLGGNYYHGIKAIRECPNVWVDISGTPDERDAVDYALKHVGFRRILFGTDMPGIGLHNCIAQIDEADATTEEKESMFYKNALRLFGRLSK